MMKKTISFTLALVMMLAVFAIPVSVLAENNDAKFDLVIEGPDTYSPGEEIDVFVKVKNITATNGTDRGLTLISAMLYYDNSKLELTSDLNEDDENAIMCIEKVPATNWENLCNTEHNFDDDAYLATPTNAGWIEVAVATINCNKKNFAVNDGDITLKFTFKVKNSARGDISIYFDRNTIEGATNSPDDLIMSKGNSVDLTISEENNTPLAITKQPASVAVQSGKTAKVSFTASGDGLTYKWYYKNKGESKFAATTAFKSNTYSVTMDATRAGRQVYCVVTDKSGKTVKTDTVTLGMTVKITKQPTTVSVQSGKVAKVTVKASGEGQTYKWYYKDKDDNKFILTKTFKSNYYSITMDSSRAGRQVYCEITDKYGNKVRTNTVTLGMAVKITKQPTSVAVQSGKVAKVTVSASGEGKTYKWYFKDKGDTKFTLTNTFKSNYYSVTMAGTRAGRQVYCVITDKYGNKVQTKTVTLGMAAKITTQPTSVKVANGSQAKVTVKASGEGLKYKWYFKDKGASKFTLTTSYTSNIYSVKMTNARAGRQLYCIITDKYGNKVQTKTVTINKK